MLGCSPGSAATDPARKRRTVQAMDFARITADGRVTDGDMIAFEVEDDHVVLRKVVLESDGYLQGLTSTLSGWDSPEDEAAWRDL